MKKLLAFIFWGLLWCEGAYALPKCKGDDHAKWTQCLGSYLNSNKNKITAEYGKRPGVVDGKYLWEKNDKVSFLKTQKKNDKTTGHFFLRLKHNSENDDRTEISGFFLKNGTNRGKHSDYYSNGDKSIFIGELDGILPKKGTLFYFMDGERYYGDSFKGFPNGKGHLTYKDGSKYYGELKYFEKYKKSKRHGKGTLTYSNGIIEKGIWKEDNLIK